MADKKLNPRFLMGARSSKVEKKLDEISEKPKRVVRRDWSHPTIAKGETAVEVDIQPALAADSVVIDFETDEVEDSVVVDEGEIVTDGVVGDDVVSGEVKGNGLSDGSGEVSPVKPVRRVNPAFNLGVEAKPVKSKPPRVLVKDEHVVDEGDEFSSGTDSQVESDPEATLEEKVTSATLVRNRNLLRPGRKPAPRFTGGGVPRPSAERARYGESVSAPKQKGFPAPKPEHELKDQRPHVLKAKSGVGAEDWTEDTSTDTNRGFGGEGNVTTVEPELGVGFHLTDRDITIIRFLARYRYAYAFQIARLVGTSVRSINPRLRKLAERGFVRKQTVTGNQHIWLSTKAGNLVTDIDLPAIKEGSLSWVTVAHTLGLGNIGIELEIGGDNVLKEAVWPTYNKFNSKGERVVGERVLTEKEIRQGQQKWRMNRTTAEMREVVENAIEDKGELTVHPQTGELGYWDAPELIDGNEGLYVIYGQVEHIPDMVVSRGRDADGKPINIAIELELNPKTTEDWRRILRTYRDHGHMYDKLVYFTHKRTIFNLLDKINREDIGLPPERFMIRKYTPKNGREPFWG